MTIPDFQTLMLPVLKFAATKDEHTLREAVDFLKTEFAITPDEERLLIPSGQPIFYNRVGWARTYLKQAGLLESTRRRYLKITNKGKSVLKENNAKIDMKYLEKFPEYLNFRDRTRTTEHETEREDGVTLTPEESLDSAYLKIKDDLAREILENIIRSSPAFFERLVVELLVKMGYGGSESNAGRVIGQVGDEGIDGVIDEDKLGLDSIYIQAKKWAENPVGRPEIQRFVGALQGRRAKKGIFITASKFSEQARIYASSVETRVVLIDGSRLADLMIEYNVGVSTISSYEVKRIDTDYFTEAQ
jgi:restriction system protein